jgi:nitrate reductase gamma subunit
MYAFLTGPMLWLSFAICIVGCVYRAVKYVKGLSWQLDRVPYGYYRSLAIKGALKSIFHWLTPFASRSWRVKPVFAAAFFLLHIGLVLVPIFLYAHIMLLGERFGITWPALPAGLADALTILSIAAGAFILLRRFALPEVRIITTAHDIWVMAISLAPLVTGFVAAHQTGENNGWLLAHIITGEIWLIAIPFTKLSHVVLFFCSRAQIGVDFGVKRGGQRGSGIVW